MDEGLIHRSNNYVRSKYEVIPHFNFIQLIFFIVYNEDNIMNLFSREKRMNLAVITYHNNGGLKLFTLSVRVRGLGEYIWNCLFLCIDDDEFSIALD